MAEYAGFWFKLTHMKKDLLLKKLLSFDNTYVVAVRPFVPGNSLPQGKEREFRVITGTKGFWYADPVLFTREGETWLFLEAYDRKELLGRIACCRLEGESVSEPRIVLKENFHMSFPQVFQWNGDIYMIPETGDDRSIRLYRAVRFPEKWELVSRCPTDGAFVDTVVLQKEPERLTLLTSELSAERQYYQRYHKMYLSGKGEEYILTEDEAFLSHQRFSYRARNAGAPYEEEGRKILPTQESTETVYGVRINFVHPEENGTDIFSDPFGRFSPEDVRVQGCRRGCLTGGRRLDGVHSYARTDQYEVIDLLYNEFAPLKYYWRLMKRLRRDGKEACR